MHALTYGATRFGRPFVECTCGKAAAGDWTEPTVNKIVQEHLSHPDLSMIQCAKNVTGDRSNWSPDDEGFPWGASF